MCLPESDEIGENGRGGGRRAGKGGGQHKTLSVMSLASVNAGVNSSVARMYMMYTKWRGEGGAEERRAVKGGREKELTCAFKLEQEDIAILRHIIGTFQAQLVHFLGLLFA